MFAEDDGRSAHLAQSLAQRAACFFGAIRSTQIGRPWEKM
jgi:hypothetical protein